MNNEENKVDIEKYNNNIKNLDFLKNRIGNLMEKLYNDTKKEILDTWVKKWNDKYKDKDNFCLEAKKLRLNNTYEGIYVPLKKICEQFPLPKNSPEDKETSPYNFPEDKDLLLGLFVDLNNGDKYEIHPWVGLYSKDPNKSYWKFAKCLSIGLKDRQYNLGEVHDELSNKGYGDSPKYPEYTLWTDTSVDNGPECFYIWLKAIAKILSQKK